MAPEQASGNKRGLTTATDVYGLGAVLYALLTGKPPFQGESVLETLERVREGRPDPPSGVGNRVDKDLETICLKCLEKEPGKRYHSAEELADELERWLNLEPIHARPVGGAEQAWRWCRRQPVLAGLIGTIILIAALGSGGIIWQWRASVRNANDARNNELMAREQQKQANQARIEAEQNRDQVRQANEALRRHAYLLNLNLAQREWEDGSIARVMELLEEERPKKLGDPDLRGFEWYFVDRLCHSEQMTLNGGNRFAWSVSFSHDGKRLAATTESSEVQVWDLMSRRVTHSLRGHDDTVRAVSFSRDRRWIATGSKDRTVRIWDASTGREVRALRGHDLPIERVEFSPLGDRMASMGSQGGSPSPIGEIRAWDLRTGKESFAIKAPSSYIYDLAFSPDGRELAAATVRRQLETLDIDPGCTDRTRNQGIQAAWFLQACKIQPGRQNPGLGK